ncbi:MAG TPA: metallophosphoesterase family protein [Rhizomicrobium sp.]|jgi:3',5'-cyclic AMP phosphodiesterase CpdA|nr:metallophosphoesterase family protein [Rhizomicrobium sp.]
MRTVVHISDLHFGRITPDVLPPLRETILAVKPDVVVVSGDLTQRAKSQEFTEARAFLDTLPTPQIVVPGNHDIPLYNVFKRWLTPLRNYKRLITSDLDPYFEDNEIAVAGINTARSFAFKDGRINTDQTAQCCTCFAQTAPDAVRIVATHHPFALADVEATLVGRAEMAMDKFAECGVDIILSGHMHESHTIMSTERYKKHGRSALLIQAGTATSTRRRGEANAFNILKIDTPRLTLDRLVLNDTGIFAKTLTETFERRETGWVIV